MKIEVVADISEEEKITIRFDKLSLEDAIKRLSSARKEAAREKLPRPEPFKFEFDPSEFMEEGQ